MARKAPSTGAESSAPPQTELLAHALLVKLRPVANQLEASRAVRVQHANFDHVFTAILREHMILPPGHIIVVIGCTGVGKTTMREVLLSQLRNHFHATATPEHEVPLLDLDLKLEAERGFVWRRFYIAQLRPLPEPMLDKKVDILAELRKLKHSGVVLRGELDDQETGFLRDVVEIQFKLRGVKFVLVDELNLLAEVKATAKELKTQMEILKSLAASVLETRYVCFGTIEALPLLGLSSQLHRRVQVIPFLNYGSSDNDLEALGNAVLGFLKGLPNGHSISLEEHIEDVQATCAGLFGVTTDWIVRSNVDALSEGRPLRWSDLRRHKPTRQLMESLAGDVAKLRDYLARVPSIAGRGRNAGSLPARGGRSGERRRPGKRNPGRDKQLR